MTIPAPDDFVHSLHALDLGAIDAVGFDLDHTLALYDDQAVNLLAAEETVSTLRIRGYAPSTLPVEIQATVARGLSMDLRHGNVIKLGADGRVRLARRGTSWLPEEEIRNDYRGHDPADEASTWHVHSPFDAPTLWFFSTLGPSIRTAADSAYAARLLRDIRGSLDESHTRGELKKHIARDLGRFVSPAGALVDHLERWKDTGKHLFVVTNSDRDFATRVLDHVTGGAWRSIFDVVVMDAGKPRFFSDGAAHPPLVARDGHACVLDYGNAAMVEAHFDLRPERILYAGDNARADVIPARHRGWRTAHVVAELSAPAAGTPWDHALIHGGDPTWFAKTVRDHADVVCARIDALLDLAPDARLVPGPAFYDRIARCARPSGRDVT
ncbi:MAG TPA: 5'-nucleotidase domain-containing protein [Candidatus Krumholzibacteria bacterium]